MSMQIEGIHTALVTPLKSDGSLDEEALIDLVEEQLKAGVQGLVVAGGTGEGLTLTDYEIERVLAITIKAAGHRVPVTAHVSALSTSSTVRNTERARASGARIAMLQAPFDAPLTDDELIQHFAAVAKVGLPIMVYNNVSTGVSLSTGLITRLAQIEGISYLKDSSSDAARMAEIQIKTKGTIQVVLGKDSFALFGFLSGGQAAVLGSANAIPRACVLLHHLSAVKDNTSAARALWLAMAPLLNFFETESYVGAVKAATSLNGLDVGDPRLPTRPLSQGKYATLQALLRPVAEAVAAADLAVSKE